ncbi:MAG: C10 family peptidase [Lentisphaerae bacterium]|nr:C10 family peptidase [Lentisphaerota bacterium]
MKRRTSIIHLTAAALLLTGRLVVGAPASATMAERAARGWLRSDSRPLHAVMASKLGAARTFHNESGDAIYHVISLSPSGFVVVSADDLLEPIVAFSATGTFDASEESPLFSLLQRDLAGRILAVQGKQKERLSAGAARQMNRLALGNVSRWGRILEMADDGGMQRMQLTSVSDVRVAPLVQSTWGQSTVAGLTCYNYYTPNNYLAGCVATMMSQLMRYHEWPVSGVGTSSYTIWVDGVPSSEALRGGDGSGGAYNWATMPLTPGGSITLAERQMIGSLVHDAATSVGMDFTASGSGASTWDAANQLVSRFGYSKAIKGYNSGGNIGAGLTGMINPNLNAGMPVMIAIRRTGGGHAVVVDGYGYQGATLYHHVNMGWSGLDNAWYNLPDIDAYYHYTSIDTCVYNIFTQGGGEIISGRVTDTNGVPVSGLTISAENGGSPLTDVTDASGLYAIVHAQASSTYTVSVTDLAYAPTNRSVLVGLSSHYVAVSGNRDGIDFELKPGNANPPVLSGVVNKAAQVGTLLTVAVSASDADGPVPALSAPVRPATSLFTDNTDGTGSLSWTPQVSDIGDHPLRVVATDGVYSDSRDASIHVSSFALTSPLHSTVMRAGDTVEVSWTGAWALEAADLSIWKNGAWVGDLTNGVLSPTEDMSVAITLPGDLKPGDYYDIRVTDSSAPQDFAQSELLSLRGGGLTWLLLLLD